MKMMYAVTLLAGTALLPVPVLAQQQTNPATQERVSTGAQTGQDVDASRQLRQHVSQARQALDDND